MIKFFRPSRSEICPPYRFAPILTTWCSDHSTAIHPAAKPASVRVAAMREAALARVPHDAAERVAELHRQAFIVDAQVARKIALELFRNGAFARPVRFENRES